MTRKPLLDQAAKDRAEIERLNGWLARIEAAAGMGSLTQVVAHQVAAGVPGDHGPRLRDKRVAEIVTTVTEESAWRRQVVDEIAAERDRLRAQIEDANEDGFGWKPRAETAEARIKAVEAEIQARQTPPYLDGPYREGIHRGLVLAVHMLGGSCDPAECWSHERDLLHSQEGHQP